MKTLSIDEYHGINHIGKDNQVHIGDYLDQAGSDMKYDQHNDRAQWRLDNQLAANGKAAHWPHKQRRQAHDLVSSLDPVNRSNYQKIGKGG
jgi:hypothetical protein